MLKITTKTKLWISVVISATLPILLGLALTGAAPDWKWSNYPFHSMLESIGALSALTIATLMIIMVRHSHLPGRYIFAAGALIGMGILDGFHAVLHAGASFVWLHSIATMVGGILFAGVWFPVDSLSRKNKLNLITSIVLSSVFIGIISIIFPVTVPPMVVNGQFTLLAITINVIGGLGFLIGAAYFVHSYKQNNHVKKISDIYQNESIVFANHCVLFGVAGLLFEVSTLWDAGWWLWHVLRFLAYEIVLIYFFMLFKKGQDALVQNEAVLEKLNHKLEQRVKERTFELERASKAKSVFLTHMSHELRTPLNAILGFCQLLQIDKNKIDEDQRDNIEEISKAGDHLLSMVNEIIDFTQIESGKVELKSELQNIIPLIDECIDHIQPAAQVSSLQIEKKITESRLMAVVDKSRFKQVLLNLLSNAIKYNKEGGDIKITYSTPNEDKLRINVYDSGIGIDKSLVASIFEPFKQIGDSNTVEGAGIGLTLAKRLVLAMKGDIGVESIVGEGSMFWVEFPVNPNFSQA